MNKNRQDKLLADNSVRKSLVGQTISSIAFNSFDDGRGGFTSDPVIVLGNGTRVIFSVDETEQGAYGITIKTV